jgi:hypothetical protein
MSSLPWYLHAVAPTAVPPAVPVAMGSGGPRPGGHVVATHLGTGLADVVFGTAILAEAERRGLGTLLPR